MDDRLIGAIVAVFLLGIVLTVFTAFLAAVVLMVALSLIHEDASIVPALGFWASFGVLLALALIGSALRGVQVNARG